MRTKDELFRAAQREIAARRQRAVTLAENAHRHAIAAHPEIAAAEAQRASAGALFVRLSARGAEDARCVQAQQALQSADQSLENAIRESGYTPKDFVPPYTCQLCQDTGICKGHPCRCVQELARTLRRQEINAASPLALCSFDTFLLDCYPTALEEELGSSPRDYMRRVLKYSKKYAETFGKNSCNLFFSGDAGLGKTHLALAIADAVLDRGFDVLYTSSAALAAQLGKEHFSRETDDTWLEACKDADLLILDDLGTEFITPFTISVLYELINTRMLCGLPTIYTTNILDMSVFEARYTEKVASRIFGNCKPFKFFGTDQRLKNS